MLRIQRVGASDGTRVIRRSDEAHLWPDGADVAHPTVARSSLWSFDSHCQSHRYSLTRLRAHASAWDQVSEESERAFRVSGASCVHCADLHRRAVRQVAEAHTARARCAITMLRALKCEEVSFELVSRSNWLNLKNVLD